MDSEETRRQQHEKIRQQISGFRLMDDELMTLVFDGNVEGIQLVLNILLERSDLTVTDVKAQDIFKNVNGHSVRFDIHAKDRAGIQYDIEIQRADQGASAQRARFNGSMLDTGMLNPGDDYPQLHDAYVIFHGPCLSSARRIFPPLNVEAARNSCEARQFLVNWEGGKS